MQLDHITSAAVRDVLSGADHGGDAIADALSETERCFAEDLHIEEIPFHTLEARNDALCDAQQAWNEDGDEEAAIEALRRFWMV
jgi:hypothetical protein